MNNFARVVRLALMYRWTLAGVVLSSLLVAVLWGANIATVYPFVKVVFQGQSPQVWLNEQLAKSEALAGEIEAEQVELRAKLKETGNEEEQASLAARLSYLDSELAARRQAHQKLRNMQPWIERYLPTDAFRTLLLVMFILFIGTLLKGICLVVNMSLVGRISNLTTFEFHKLFFRRTLRMNLSDFRGDSTSDLMSRFTNDVEQVRSGLTILFGNTVREPLKMVACFAGAAFISWRLLILSLIVAPIGMLLITRLARSIKRANRRALEEISQMYKVLAESFGGIQTVKAFTMERYERRRFHHVSKVLFGKWMKIIFYNAMIKPIGEVMGIFIISFAILAGGYLVLNQQTHLFGLRITAEPMSVGALMAFYAFLAGVSDPARKIGEIINQLQRSAAACDRIYEMCDREPAVTDPPVAKRLPQPFREIVFENVSFSYLPGEPVLRGINLKIRAGETLAIVGPNGCGKSTLANLLLRFYDVKEGTIRFDQVAVNEVRMAELRRRIGVVTQKTTLFDDTVLNNIRYGSLAATDAQVMAAAKKAHAHGFISEKLELGYKTMVGEGGSRLSGGQEQRIALARAILRNPEILILDEATSQIDGESELLIHKALKDFTRDRTSIMITHRASTLALADRILVMEAGRISDLGTHDELIARCEVYRRLYQGQFRESA